MRASARLDQEVVIGGLNKAGPGGPLRKVSASSIAALLPTGPNSTDVEVIPSGLQLKKKQDVSQSSQHGQSSVVGNASAGTSAWGSTACGSAVWLW